MFQMLVRHERVVQTLHAHGETALLHEGWDHFCGDEFTRLTVRTSERVL